MKAGRYAKRQVELTQGFLQEWQFFAHSLGLSIFEHTSVEKKRMSDSHEEPSIYAFLETSGLFLKYF